MCSTAGVLVWPLQQLAPVMVPCEVVISQGGSACAGFSHALYGHLGGVVGAPVTMFRSL